MKKSILATVALTAFSATGLAAQNMNAGGNVPAVALWTGTVQALAFGTMTPSLETADREIDVVATDVDATNGNAGYIDIRLNKNGTILGFDLAETLESSDAEDAGTLSVDSYECGFEKSGHPVNTPTTPTEADLDGHAATCTDATTLTVTGMTGASIVRIYLGATVLGSDIDAVLADTYTGTITFSATLP